MKKRLFFVGGNLYPDKVGGYEVFNYYLSDSLTKKYKVTVLNVVKIKDYPSARYIKFCSLQPSALLAPIQYLFYFLFLRNKKESIVLLSYSRVRWPNIWIYPVMRKWMGIRYLVTIHGGGLTKWDWPIIHRSFLQNAGHLIGVSERICNEYTRRTSRKITYLPPLVPFSKFQGDSFITKKKFNLNSDSKIVLIVGSLKALKNPQTIVEAGGILGIDYLKAHSLHFVFAGDGKMKAQLVERTTSLGIKEYFHFLGNVYREELPALFSMADIYIMASDFEGTPLSLMEAMFNSLIVIGSDVQGINNIIGNDENGFLFKHKDSHELADLLVNISKMPSKEIARIKENANRFIIQKYDYNVMLNKYIEIIEDI